MTAASEEKLARLDGAYEHVAIKADLERANNTLTWRLIGAQLLIGGAIVGVLRLLE